jgi:hypothetical protein
MGILKNGILGGFSKKTGNMVGVSWRRLNVIRSIPAKSLKAPTQAQTNQRARFGMVTTFLSEISVLIEIGYQSKRRNETPMNRAVAKNLAIAIADDGPVLTLNYSKVSFSEGRLELPENVSIEAISGSNIKFSWSIIGKEYKYFAPTDRTTLLVYNPLKNNFAYKVSAAARMEQYYNFTLPESFIGNMVHCYLSFNSVKTKGLVSPSYYAGQVTLI